MRRGPTTRDAFRADILKSSLIGEPCRVFLLHLTTVTVVDPMGAYGGHPMTDGGRVKASREELAEAFGVGVRWISERIREATRAGLLSKQAGGRNGQVVVYQAHPQGSARTATYTGPASLCAFVKPLVGTWRDVPGEASEDAVGTWGDAPYARAHYSKNDAGKQPAHDGSRVEPEHQLDSQAGTYKGFIRSPSKRSSLDPEEGAA